MEIIQERLEREFNQMVITTVPNVSFVAETTKGQTIIVNNPTEMPDPSRLEGLRNRLSKHKSLPNPSILAIS
jgi:GTP-binding protein LepA